MTKREMTCVVCPSGCKLTVTVGDDRAFISVTGNTCPRGEKYASDEITHPLRTLTSTVTLDLGANTAMLPVKTDRPIPKDSLFAAMEIIRRLTVSSPVKMGDVLISDFIEKGTNLISCKDVE